MLNIAPIVLLPLGILAGPAPLPEPFVFAQFGSGAERPFAGDLDGDGFAELVVAVSAGDGAVWSSRNERGQKAHGGEVWGHFVQTVDEPVAAGDFDGNGRLDLAAISRSGAVALARPDAAGKLAVTAAAGRAPVAGDVTLRAADGDGDKVDDLFVVTGEAVFFLRSNGRGGFERATLLGSGAPREALAADLDGDRKAEVFWLDAAGTAIAVLGGASHALPVAAEAIIAAGDAGGEGRAAIAVAGAWLRLEGGKLAAIPDARLRPLPAGAACGMADMDGDGCEDLVVFARRGRCDVTVSLSRFPEWYGSAAPGSRDLDADGLADAEELYVFGTDPLRRDTDRDGLLDGWEARGTFRGVRLDKMGASPRHKDVFLELDVEQGADMARVERAIARIKALYANGPVENPDGKPGIAMHCEVDTRVPRWPPLPPAAPPATTSGGGPSPAGPPPEPPPGRQELRELFFTPSRAGIFHWMHLGAEGGGGQADFLSDHGSCAGVFEATLPHEFGHQLGLNHGGGDGMNGIPHYPSLMNYAYNYQLGGRGEAIDYSRGALAHLSLDERALPERVAVPAAALAYLSGPPFHFKVEARDDGKASWIDWDRDAVEDEAPVRANINAASGEGYGGRAILDQVAPLGGGKTTRTLEQPALVALPAADGRPEALALVYVPREGGGLAARLLEQDDWSKFGPEERAAAAPADLHQITATVDAKGVVHVFGTSAGKVVALPGTRAGAGTGTIAWGDATTFDWTGVPAVCADGAGAVCVVLRREDGALAGRRVGGDAAEVAIEGVRSSCPAALALDTVKGHLLLATSDVGTDRMRLSRLDPKTFGVVSTEPVGGEKGGDATNQRAAVVFGTGPWLPPEGEIGIYVAGKYDLKNRDPNSCTHMFRCYTIGDKAWLGRGGWKCDMTWNEWTYTLSGVGVAWFKGRPWHAGRFFTIPVWDPGGLKDSLCIGPSADGICDSGLRDWNDWEIITATGLERSILHAHTPRGRR